MMFFLKLVIFSVITETFLSKSEDSAITNDCKDGSVPIIEPLSSVEQLRVPVKLKNLNLVCTLFAAFMVTGHRGGGRVTLTEVVESVVNSQSQINRICDLVRQFKGIAIIPEIDETVSELSVAQATLQLGEVIDNLVANVRAGTDIPISGGNTEVSTPKLTSTPATTQPTTTSSSSEVKSVTTTDITTTAAVQVDSTSVKPQETTKGGIKPTATPKMMVLATRKKNTDPPQTTDSVTEGLTTSTSINEGLTTSTSITEGLTTSTSTTSTTTTEEPSNLPTETKLPSTTVIDETTTELASESVTNTEVTPDTSTPTAGERTEGETTMADGKGKVSGFSLWDNNVYGTIQPAVDRAGIVYGQYPDTLPDTGYTGYNGVGDTYNQRYPYNKGHQYPQPYNPVQHNPVQHNPIQHNPIQDYNQWPWLGRYPDQGPRQQHFGNPPHNSQNQQPYLNPNDMLNRNTAQNPNNWNHQQMDPHSPQGGGVQRAGNSVTDSCHCEILYGRCMFGFRRTQKVCSEPACAAGAWFDPCQEK